MTTATVKAIGQAMNTISLVNKAISIRDTEQKKKHYYDQCWVVFDKDDFPAKDFNQAITLAQKNGFRVAYSNQAFEYWFLLHFNLYRGPLHRQNYADMLSKRKHSKKCTFYTLRFGCSFAAVNTIKPQLL